MISAQVFGVERLQANLARLGQDLDRAEKSVAVRGSILVRKALVRHMSGAFAGRDPFWGKKSPAGPFLGSRTGQTRARLSPGGVAIKTGSRWTAAVGSPDAYVLLHETGGMVQGHQFLRIPTARAQTAGGQDRFAGMSIRDIPGAFLFRSLAGKLWAALPPPAGSGEGPTLLYLLVRSVRLRARGLFAAVRAEVQPLIRELGGAEVSVAVGRANG